MSSMQYIGARYVPIVYTNPDDNSADWKAGVTYEALTVVTYNGDSYTSKKAVPNLVGNPAENPEYWVKTGDFNASLLSLQNRVGAVENDINNPENGLKVKVNSLENIVGDNALPSIFDNVTDAIIKLNSFATPEMYGAKGDGTTDDTQAVQNCIDNNICVYLPKNYLISETIRINEKQIILGNKYGKLTTTENIIMIDATDRSFWCIDGVELVKNTTNNKFHIVASGASFTISNCTFKNGSDATNFVGGIQIIKSEDNAHDNFNAKILNNQLIFSNIEIAHHTDGFISKNIIWASTENITPARYAIKVEANSWSIEDNQTVGGSSGNTYLKGRSGAAMFNVVNNFFDGSYDNVLSGTHLIVEDVANTLLITNNRFFNAYKNSISLINCNNGVIADNSFVGNNRSETETYEISISSQTYGNRHSIKNNTFAYYNDSDAPYKVFESHTNDYILYDGNVITGYKGTRDEHNYIDTYGVVCGDNIIDGRLYKKYVGVVQALDVQYGFAIPRALSQANLVEARVVGVADATYSLTQKVDGYVCRHNDNSDVGKVICAIVYFYGT